MNHVLLISYCLCKHIKSSGPNLPRTATSFFHSDIISFLKGLRGLVGKGAANHQPLTNGSLASTTISVNTVSGRQSNRYTLKYTEI